MVQLIPIKSKLSEFESITISFETSICYKLKKKKIFQTFKVCSLSFPKWFFFFLHSPLIFPFSSVLATIYNCMTGANWISRRRLFISAMMKEEEGWKMLTEPGTMKLLKKEIQYFFSNDKKVNFLYLTTNLWWKEACMDWFYSLSQIHQRKK